MHRRVHYERVSWKKFHFEFCFFLRIKTVFMSDWKIICTLKQHFEVRNCKFKVLMLWLFLHLHQLLFAQCGISPSCHFDRLYSTKEDLNFKRDIVLVGSVAFSVLLGLQLRRQIEKSDQCLFESTRPFWETWIWRLSKQLLLQCFVLTPSNVENGILTQRLLSLELQLVGRF